MNSKFPRPSKGQYVCRNVALTHEEDQAVRQVVEAEQLGQHGYSEAVRRIIREWQQLKALNNRTVQS